jgi:cytosine/adenosine deaminase-related metal-dependent hydrolase
VSDRRLYRARWVIPVVSSPVAEGAVAVADGRVLAVGAVRELARRFPEAPVVDLGRAAILPGLVNAHTHLSLTRLPRPPARGGPFFPRLRELALAASALEAEAVRASVRAGIAESVALGTAAVGEITTRAEGVGELEADTRLASRVYFEFLGITEPAARERFATAANRARSLAGANRAHIRAGLSPHAPYSVWPDLWKATHELARIHDLLWSTHLGEAPGEDRFLTEGTGPAVEYLKSWNAWDGTFPVPGRRPAAFLAGEGVLDHRALLVHGVHLTPDDRAIVAASGAFVCLCPRSNAYLGLPPPPVEALAALGIPLCLGTDSRGSNDDLSVWAEMRAVRRLAPEIPAAAVLAMATVTGARALGLRDEAGAIAAGRRWRGIAVETDARDADDLLEILVREPVERAVRPLGGSSAP